MKKYAVEYEGKKYAIEWDGDAPPTSWDVDRLMEGYLKPTPPPTPGPVPTSLDYDPSGSPEPWAADAGAKIAGAVIKTGKTLRLPLDLLAAAPSGFEGVRLPTPQEEETTPGIVVPSIGQTAVDTWLPKAGEVGDNPLSAAVRGVSRPAIDMATDPTMWGLAPMAAAPAALRAASPVLRHAPKAFAAGGAVGAGHSIQEAYAAYQAGEDPNVIIEKLAEAGFHTAMAGLMLYHFRSGKTPEQAIQAVTNKQSPSGGGRPPGPDIVDAEIIQPPPRLPAEQRALPPGPRTVQGEVTPETGFELRPESPTVEGQVIAQPNRMLPPPKPKETDLERAVREASEAIVEEEKSARSPRVKNNASGESAASSEAISRQNSMKAKKERYVVFDRAGNVRLLIGPEAVDYVARPGETYGIMGLDGFRTLDNKGGKVPVREKSHHGPKKDTLGSPIYPGQESWTPEFRRMVHEAAKWYAEDIASRQKSEPTVRGKAIKRFDTTTAGGGEIIGSYSITSHLRGTPFEDLMYQPHELARAARSKRMSPTLLAMHEAIAKSVEDNPEYQDYLQRQEQEALKPPPEPSEIIEPEGKVDTSFNPMELEAQSDLARRTKKVSPNDVLMYTLREFPHVVKDAAIIGAFKAARGAKSLTNFLTDVSAKLRAQGKAPHDIPHDAMVRAYEATKLLDYQDPREDVDSIPDLNNPPPGALDVGPIYSSTVERIIKDLGGKPIHGNSLWNHLMKKGATPSELEDLGLSFLKGSEKIYPHQEILEKVEKGKLVLEEENYGNASINTEAHQRLNQLAREFQEEEARSQRAVDELRARLRRQVVPGGLIGERQMDLAVDALTNEAKDEPIERTAWADRFLTELNHQMGKKTMENLLLSARLVAQATQKMDIIQEEQRRLTGSHRTAWDSLTLPGGEGYYERALKIPIPEAAKTEHPGTYKTPAYDNEMFTGQHFGGPNTIIHQRQDFRTDADGKMGILANEWQSDWHQRAQRETDGQPASGYRGEVDREYLRLRAKNDQTNQAYHAAFLEWNKAGRPDSGPLLERKDQTARASVEASDEIMAHEREHYPGQDADSVVRQRSPNAPLKKDSQWTKAAMIRLVRDAAEKGAERIYWPSTPEQVSRIEWNGQPITTYDKPGWYTKWNGKLDGPYPDQKTASEQIQPGFEVEIKVGQPKYFLGIRDMTPIINRYLIVAPKVMKGMVEKYGGKVGKVRIGKEPTPFNDGTYTPNDSHEVFYADIPPSLRYQSLSKGLSPYDDSAQPPAPKRGEDGPLKGEMRIGKPGMKSRDPRQGRLHPTGKLGPYKGKPPKGIKPPPVDDGTQQLDLFSGEDNRTKIMRAPTAKMARHLTFETQDQRALHKTIDVAIGKLSQAKSEESLQGYSDAVYAALDEYQRDPGTLTPEDFAKAASTFDEAYRKRYLELGGHGTNIMAAVASILRAKKKPPARVVQMRAPRDKKPEMAGKLTKEEKRFNELKEKLALAAKNPDGTQGIISAEEFAELKGMQDAREKASGKVPEKKKGRKKKFNPDEPLDRAVLSAFVAKEGGLVPPPVVEPPPLAPTPEAPKPAIEPLEGTLAERLAKVERIQALLRLQEAELAELSGRERSKGRLQGTYSNTPQAIQALREKEQRKALKAPTLITGETEAQRYERKAREAMRRQREGQPTAAPRKGPSGNMNIGMERRPRGKGKKGEEGAILTDLLTLPLRLPYKIVKGAFVPPPGWVDPNHPAMPQAHRETADKLYEHYQFALLSAFGPLKQATDSVMLALRPVELVTAAALDAARVALHIGGPRQRFFAELPAWIQGVVLSTSIPSRLGLAPSTGDDALSLGMKFFQEGDQNPFLYGPGADMHQRAVGGKYGYGVRIFHRTAGLGQGIAQGLTRGGEKGVQAVRTAKAYRFSKARQKALVHTWTRMPLDMLPPTPEENISKTELERTMVERLSGLWGYLNHGRLTAPGGRIIFPFFQFATNGMKTAFKRIGLPFNLAGLFADMKAGRVKGTGELEDRVANMIIALVITIGLVEGIRRKFLIVEGGNIGANTNTKNYSQQEAGRTPWTFRLPGADWNIPIELMGPAVAPSVALAASYVKATEEEARQNQPGMKKQSNVLAWHLFNAQTEFIAAPYLRDLYDVLSVMWASQDPEAAARLERMFGKTSAGMGVPRIVARAANALDSDEQGHGTQRATMDPGGDTWKTLGNYMKRDVPWLREDLPPLKSRTGKVVKDPRPPAERFFAPWKRTPAFLGDRIAEKEFVRLGWVPSGVPKKLSIPDQDGAWEEKALTQGQIDALYGTQAEATQQAEDFMRSKEYGELPDWLKIRVLKKIYNAHREGAFGAVRGEMLEGED